MTPEELKIELIKQRIELWKTTVGTQQHFNSLQLQLRNFALTLYLAVLTVIGYAIKEHLHMTAFACLAGIVIVGAFYYMDWGYHRLLKGAVAHGRQIEESLKGDLPEAELAKAISDASKAEKFLGFISSDSSRRLDCFYFLLAIALIATAIFAHCATFGVPSSAASGNASALVAQSPTKDTKTLSGSPPTVASVTLDTREAQPNAPEAKANTQIVCATEALKSYYSSGRYLRNVAQTAELGRRWLAEKIAALPIGTKPAIVLDIDETALSTWPILFGGEFCWDAARFSAFVEAGKAEGIEPVRGLFQFAVENGIATFFVTSRSEKHRASTEANLKAAGFHGYQELIMKPDGPAVSGSDFKTQARKHIVDGGLKIIMSIGDQLGDLGEAVGSDGLLIPNPFYNTK